MEEEKNELRDNVVTDNNENSKENNGEENTGNEEAAVHTDGIKGKMAVRVVCQVFAALAVATVAFFLGRVSVPKDVGVNGTVAVIQETTYGTQPTAAQGATAQGQEQQPTTTGTGLQVAQGQEQTTGAEQQATQGQEQQPTTTGTGQQVAQGQEQTTGAEQQATQGQTTERAEQQPTTGHQEQSTTGTEQPTTQEQPTSEHETQPAQTEEQTTTGSEQPTTEGSEAATQESEQPSSEQPSSAQASVESGSTPYEVHGKLSIDGIRMLDEHGELFQLRGVSTHGIGWFPQYVNYDTFAELRSWGANAVRIAMYTGEGGYCQTDDNGRQNIEKLVDTGVQAATELGMYVIIDWHILSDGNPMNYADKSEEFFRKITDKYKDYGNVIYEICNEPNGGVDWNTVKSYAERIIPVIRENAKDAIIIVGTPTWSQDVDIAAGNPITGYDNIVYAMHFYADTHRDNLRIKLNTALRAGIPVFVSEFGICDASGSGANNISEGNIWIDTLDGYGISYFIWSLSNKGETASLIKSGNNKLYGFEDGDLSEAGRWYKGILGERMDGSVEIGNVDFRGDQYSGQGGQGGGSGGGQEWQPTEPETVQAGADNCSASVVCTTGWQSGDLSFGQFNLTVENTSADLIGGWTVEITFASEIELSQSWNCSATVSGRTITVVPVTYNSTVESGASRGDIGLIISGDDLTVESVIVK